MTRRSSSATRWPFCRRVRLPGVARRLEVVAVLVVPRLRDLIVGRRAIQPVVGVLDLVLQLVDLLLVGRDLLRAPPAAAPAAAAAWSAIDAAARLLQLRLRDLVFELREAPLRVLPLAVVVVPDHPDDGQEQEQTGRREDDVQEVDVVSVPDALLFSHVRRSDIEEEFGDRHDVLQVEEPRAQHLDRQRHHHQEQEHADVVPRRAHLLVVPLEPRLAPAATGSANT